MARKSTLSKEWTELMDACGGINGICEALGMSPSTFYRASRGHVELDDDKKAALEILCDLYRCKNPLKATPKAWARDYTPLRLLGEAIEKGFPPAKRTLDKLREIYPTDQLIKLAESEGTPETILRGVQALLEEA